MELDFKWFLGILGIIIGFVSAKLFERKLAADDAEKALLTQLITQMTELKIEMKHLSDKLQLLPKVEKDLHFLHEKIRELTIKVNQ